MIMNQATSDLVAFFCLVIYTKIKVPFAEIFKSKMPKSSGQKSRNLKVNKYNLVKWDKLYIGIYYEKIFTKSN